MHLDLTKNLRQPRSRTPPQPVPTKPVPSWKPEAAALTRPEGRFKRQLREAKLRRHARLWVIERALSAEQLLAATQEARSDPQTLEHWSEQTDGMVDVYWQVRQRLSAGATLLAWLRPASLVGQVQTEWTELAPAALTENRSVASLPALSA